MKTPILGQSYVVRSTNAAAARMVNLYPEALIEGKEAAYLQRCPGLRLLTTVGSGPIRGLWAFSNDASAAYVVSGNGFYRLTPNYTATLIGNVAGSGPVSMSDNGTQLFIACNGPSYIYNADTFSLQQITDPDFPGAVTVGYLDGFFVFNEPNSQRLWVTELLDGTQINADETASAEGSPDGVVSILVDHRELWVFGTNSVEVWYNSNQPDGFPFQRIQGAFNELGCAAAYSTAKMDNSVFWLGQDARGQGIVYRANGYAGQRISTHAIEFAIQGYGTISDAVAYTYQQDGHSFYVLTFPSANATWVYDAATQVWHERASWSDGALTRHRSNCQMAFNNEVIVGDYQNGKLYAFDLDVCSDDGAIQKWLRSWRALPPGQNNLKRTAHHALQLDAETGVGLTGIDPLTVMYLATENGDPLITESGDPILATVVTTQGVNPQVMLRWSDDGGHTWSNEHWRSMGRIGEYGYRTIWRRLGMTTKLRDRVYEVSGTDPVKIAIMGAELQISPTDA